MCHGVKCIFFIEGYFDDIGVLVALLALDFDLGDAFVLFVVELVIDEEFLKLDPCVSFESIGLAVEDVLLFVEM